VGVTSAPGINTTLLESGSEDDSLSLKMMLA